MSGREGDEGKGERNERNNVKGGRGKEGEEKRGEKRMKEKGGTSCRRFTEENINKMSCYSEYEKM